MNHEQEIKRLIRARARIENRLQEVDQKIEHLFWRLDEDRRVWPPCDSCRQGEATREYHYPAYRYRDDN